MKRIKYIAGGCLSAIALFMGVTACSDIDELATSDSVFNFSAEKSSVSVTSRAVPVSEQFAAGTQYALYAYKTGSTNYLNYLSSTDPTTTDYVVGTENGDTHTISFTGNNKFRDKDGNVIGLDFYGVTSSSASLPATPATLKLNYNDAALASYMWAQKLNQTYSNSGTIALPFIHVMSKLNFRVVSQDAQSVVLTGISVNDYANGTLNLLTGKFASTTATARTETKSVFSGTHTVTTTQDSLTTTLVFPTRGTASGDALTVSGTYTVGGVAKTFSQTFTSTSFDTNYQYDVVLSFTSKVIVTIVPKYYGWITQPETKQNTDALAMIGNPVTFGGVVWADRNLGATSANPLNSAMDWERSRGWYYQFGRSIPYYVKGSIQDPAHLDETSLTTSNVPQVSQTTWSILNQSVGKPYPYVYGKYDQGPIGLINNNTRAYDLSNGSFISLGANTKSNYSADNLAKMPDATSGNFNFVVDYTNYNSYPQCPFDWDYGHSTSAAYWNTRTQQPCPKGWRLPTKEECLTIYPYDADCGDICFNRTNNTNIIGHTTISHDVDYRNTNDYPKYYIDFNNKDGQYVGVKESSSDTYATIYAIKNQGTDKAYRIKWSVKSVTGSDNRTRQVLVIERFPATASSSIVTTTTSTDWRGNTTTTYTPNYKSFTDWNSPTEVLYLPMAGLIYTRYVDNTSNQSGVSYVFPGTQALYWTSDANTTDGDYAYSFRLRIDNVSDGGQKAIFSYGYDHRGWGGMIRCVRDDSVVDK